MKQVVIVLALLFGGAAMAWATECPDGTTLQVVGTVATGNRTGSQPTEISGGGHLVRKIVVACAGTACVATLFDGDTNPSSLGNAQVKAEPGAPASTSTVNDFDPPLAFKDGIQFYDDGNVNAILLYECRF